MTNTLIFIIRVFKKLVPFPIINMLKFLKIQYDIEIFFEIIL